MGENEWNNLKDLMKRVAKWSKPKMAELISLWVHNDDFL